MAIVIQNPKKKHVAVVAGIVAIIIAMFGTFAWYSFNQQARNIFIGLVQPDVNLHDDFWEPNKDVYVENSGEKTVYVRVSFKEYMEIANESIYPGSIYDDGDTWEKHYDPSNPCPVDNCTLDFHRYYDWIMGNAAGDPNEGWKWYIPAPEELKSQYDADGNQIQDSAQTVYGVTYDTDEYGNKTVTPQVSETGHTYAEIEAAMPADTKFQNLLSAYQQNPNVTTKNALTKYAFDTWGVKMTETTSSVMTMQDWIDAGSKPGPYWVMDVDGWFYWAEALEPEQATGLLLSEVNLKNKPSNDWFYAIDVYLNAVDADEFNRLGATSDALKLLYLATGEYVFPEKIDGQDNTDIWYKKLGPNVYESGEIVTAENGTSSWQAIEKFVGGELAANGDLIEDNFIKIGDSFKFDPEGEFATTDSAGGMLDVSGNTYAITDFVRGVDGLWYFEINHGQCYVRALSEDESMDFEGSGTEMGTGLLGDGPHQVVWVPKNGPTGQPGRLGDKSNLYKNPWYETKWNDNGNVTLYHVGNGVYYRVVEEGDSTAFETETWTDPITGDVISRPKPYVSAKNRTTIEGITNEEDFKAAFIQIGDYYTKGDNNPYVESSAGAMNTDGTGAFKVVDIVYSQNDGKYYLLVDDGRQNGDGTPIYAYYAMGPDGTLGSSDDYKVWPGGNGIGSRDDTTVQPSPIPANVAVGGSFSELGKFWQQETDDKTYPQPYEYIEWDVLAIEGTKMLVITRDIIYGSQFGATSTTTWADSSLRQWLNTSFVDIAFAAGAGFNGGDAKKQIVLTEVETNIIGGYKNPGTNYIGGAKEDGGKTLDYVFLLSSEEFKKYFPSNEVRKSTFTPYTLSKKLGQLNLWTRNRYDNSGFITLVNGSTGGVGDVRQYPNQVRGVRAAMWVEFDSKKWGAYGTAGSGGSWSLNNKSNGVSGIDTWYPGKQQ